MNIICLSKDKPLLDLFNDLSGFQVTLLTEKQLVKIDTTKAHRAIVVDLRSCKIPIAENITIPKLALSPVPQFQEAVVLLQMGFKGYGNVKMQAKNMENALETIANGQMWLPPEILNQLILSVGQVATETPSAENPLKKLSKREAEVAGYVAKGMSNQEIAESIFVSLRTVKAHLSSIYEKTSFKNRLELGLFLKDNPIE